MNDRETILEVAGMTCHACVRHVDRAVRQLEGVTDVQVLLREGKVRVRHSSEVPSTAAIIAAVEAAGYNARADVA